MDEIRISLERMRELAQNRNMAQVFKEGRWKYTTPPRLKQTTTKGR